MDPIVTLAIANDPDECIDTRIEALENLAIWLTRGGFFPENGGNVTEETAETVSDSDLCAAIRVAIAYGDISGLHGLGY